MRLLLLTLLCAAFISGCGAGLPFSIRLDKDRPIIHLRQGKCFGQAERVEGGWLLRVMDKACIVYNYTTGEKEGEPYEPQWQNGQALFINDQEAELIFERWQVRNRLTVER